MDILPKIIELNLVLLASRLKSNFDELRKQIKQIPGTQMTDHESYVQRLENGVLGYIDELRNQAIER